MTPSVNVDFAPDWVSPPGDTIGDILYAQGLSAESLAADLGEKVDSVRALLSGSKSIDAHLANRLSSSLGGSADFWLQREELYQTEIQRLGFDGQHSPDYDWLDLLPVSDMVRFRWISPSRSRAERRRKCLEFFRVPDPEDPSSSPAFELPLPAYRTSRRIASNPCALAAWLRKATIEAELQSCPRPWDSRSLMDMIDEVRGQSRRGPIPQQLPTVRKLLAECGTAFALVRAPRGCRASGATFFLSKSKAALVLSGRYRTEDHFWFSLFHEIGHLVLHADRGLIVEEGSLVSDDEEFEANAFAEQCLIPSEYQREFQSLRARYRTVARFARKIGVPAGVVVGQMQHKGMISRKQLNGLKRSIDWNLVDT